MPLIEAIPPVRGRRGRPRRRPDRVYADRGYDHDKYRKQVRAAGITPVIARRGIEHGSGLGVHRWVVEQTFALLHWFRRLRIRWEIRDDIHEAFLSLACASSAGAGWPTCHFVRSSKAFPAPRPGHLKASVKPPGNNCHVSQYLPYHLRRTPGDAGGRCCAGQA